MTSNFQYFKHSLNDLNNWRVIYCKKELARKGIHQYKFKLHSGHRIEKKFFHDIRLT